MDVVADLVCVQRGGLDLDVVATRSSDEFLHHELRHRRPADVPMAEE